MAEPEEVPDGAAVLPEIPPELNVHPLLFAVLHAVVFVAGSEENLLNSAAGQEALRSIADGVRSKLGSALVVIGSVTKDKPVVVVALTPMQPLASVTTTL